MLRMCASYERNMSMTINALAVVTDDERKVGPCASQQWPILQKFSAHLKPHLICTHVVIEDVQSKMMPYANYN